MTAFSPAAAAFEGFRVLRRHPLAVGAWVGANVLLLVLIGISKLGQRAGPAIHPDAAPNLLGLIGRFGPLAYLAAPLILVLGIVVISAIFRQELRPTEGRWAYMRLGGDEVRLALLGVIGGAVVLVVAGVEFGVFFALAAAFERLYPTAVTAMRVLWVAAATAFNFWIVVRLSLAPAHTFAARRLSLFGSWSLTRRHFWGLGWMIALMILIVFVLFIVLAVITIVLGADRLRDLLAHPPAHASLATIASLAVLILLPVATPVLTSVLIYSPLAFAYRALARETET
jgi:hypothetical protein